LLKNLWITRLRKGLFPGETQIADLLLSERKQKTERRAKGYRPEKRVSPFATGKGAPLLPVQRKP